MATAHLLAAMLCTLIWSSDANVRITKETNTTVVLTIKESQQKKPEPIFPKAIEAFNDAFKKKLKNFPVLTEMFDFDLYCEPEELAVAIFYLGASLVADIGSKNVVEDANYIVRHIPDNSKKLSDDLVITVYSHSLAKYLFNEKILNTKNAEKLAQLYAEQNNETYSKVANLNYRRSQILSLPVAYVQFVVKNFKTDGKHIDRLAKVYGDEWNHQAEIGAIPEADRRYPEIRSPVNNELLKPSHKACTTSKAVQQFAESLTKRVHSSRLLLDLFKVGSPASVYRGTVYVGQFLMQKFNVKDSAILADFKAKYIDDEKARDPSLLTGVYGRAAGKHLESKKILNSKNAWKLGQKYANALEEAAKRISRTYSQKSKIVALQFGTIKFLRQLNAYQSEDGKSLAFFCGNEWFCATRGTE